MKHHIFDHTRRNICRVEEAADEDCIAADIESAEHISRAFRRPGKAWLHQSVREVRLVEPVEYFVQIDVATLRAFGSCEPATVVPYASGAFLNSVAEDKRAIRAVVGVVDLFPVQLCQ